MTWPEQPDTSPFGEPERLGDILARGAGVPGRPTGPDAELEHDEFVDIFGGCGVDGCIICTDRAGWNSGTCGGGP